MKSEWGHNSKDEFHRGIDTDLQMILGSKQRCTAHSRKSGIIDSLTRLIISLSIIILIIIHQY